MELSNGSHLDGQIGNVRIRLTYQRTFPAYTSRDDGISPYSISGERRPDMVLSVDDGNQTIMIVLDAKYRCGRDSIHSALGDMHIYRDSLKVKGPVRSCSGRTFLHRPTTPMPQLFHGAIPPAIPYWRF